MLAAGHAHSLFLFLVFFFLLPQTGEGGGRNGKLKGEEGNKGVGGGNFWCVCGGVVVVDNAKGIVGVE